MGKNTVSADEKIKLNVTFIQFLAKMQHLQEFEKAKRLDTVKKVDSQ